MGAMAAAPTRTYSRDPVIQVGEIHVAGDQTTVSPGESVQLWIGTPSDYDSWTSSDGQSGQEEDTTLFAKWSNGDTGYSTTWIAPSTQGQYRPKVTVNDDITRGSTNGRNDLLVEKAITITVKKVSATILSPSGDPTTNGVEDQNEFTFDDTADGYCYITCKAKLTPDDADAAKWAEEHITWSLSAIQGSELTWGEGTGGNFVPGDNKGKFATARLKGLPTKNDGFGLKTVTMTVDGQAKTAYIETFFSKYANNHPGDSGLSPHLGGADRSPNWFYYWNQVVGDTKNVFYGGLYDYYGYTPALGKWSLTMNFSKTEIFIGNGAAEDFLRQNNPEPYNKFTGIDAFANIVKHEKVHVQQIADADALLTQNTGIWAKGWAWNFDPNSPDTTPNNRYNPGPPIENLDKDNNLVPDTFKVNPEGKPGLEIEPKQAETIVDGTNAKLDWSSPGKQYGSGAYSNPAP